MTEAAPAVPVTPQQERDAAEDPFVVEVPGYQGPLEGLVLAAQRGDVDLAAIPLSAITTRYRELVTGPEPHPEPRQVADFLRLVGRLLTLKANRLLPDGPLQLDEEDPAAGDGPVDDPGARLAEYRLFKAAAELLLAGAAEEGARSFLGLVAPEIVPVERLAIPPEHLAAAFRRVLERLPETEPFELRTTTFSVEDKITEIRALLRDRRSVGFEEVFASVRSRLEAVACFLALLEMLKGGEARVRQPEPFGDILVQAVARDVPTAAAPPVTAPVEAPTGDTDGDGDAEVGTQP